MIRINYTERYGYDHLTHEKIVLKEKQLTFENSLLAISKWESLTGRPFYSNGHGVKKSDDDIILFIWCMLIDDGININYIYNLNTDEINSIQKYIEQKHTATTIQNNSLNNNSQNTIKLVTSEVIYYAMFARGIPIECEKWNINRLKMLIGVYDVISENEKENGKKKKSNPVDDAIKMAELNNKRQEMIKNGG